MENKYILIDEDFQRKVLSELESLKKLLFPENSGLPNKGSDEIMYIADLMAYLKVDRRTIYKYRTQMKMPFKKKENGRVYFLKSEIENYFISTKD